MMDKIDNKFIDKSNKSIFQVLQLSKYLEGHSGFLAGGCFKNLFGGGKIKDIDIFFESHGDFEFGKAYFRDHEDYVEAYVSDRSVGYRNVKTKVLLDLVCKTYGTPEQILSRFDFSITKFAYYVTEDDDWRILYHKDFFEHLNLKKLVLESVEALEFPVSTFERSLRYTRAGYGLCRESKVILVEAIRRSVGEDVGNDLYFGFD